MKPVGNHRKKEKIDEISPDRSKILCNLAGFGKDFAKSNAFFPQIMTRIAGFGVLVAEICQIVLENSLESLNSQWVVLSSGRSG